MERAKDAEAAEATNREERADPGVQWGSDELDDLL
jgi:hypothetical protein